MKKALFIMVLCVPLAAMLAVSLQSDPWAEAKESSELSALNMPEQKDLIYDEAGYIGAYLLPKGNKLGVKFTPSEQASYPFKLTHIGYAMSDFPDHDRPFNAIIYKDGSKPTTEWGRKNNVSASEPANFFWLDVSSLNITVTSGSFYAAYELVSDSFPALAIDGSSPQHHVSWFFTTFTDDPTTPRWEPFDNITSPYPGVETLGDTFDVMIRARGEVSGAIVELKPDAIEFAPSATILASVGTINYSLAEAGAVEISLWDALGRPVKTLYTGHADPGEHTLAWDACGLPRGAYFLRLKTPSAVSTAKVVLVD